jgi:hypothetical protein
VWTQGKERTCLLHRIGQSQDVHEYVGEIEVGFGDALCGVVVVSWGCACAFVVLVEDEGE